MATEVKKVDVQLVTVKQEALKVQAPLIQQAKGLSVVSNTDYLQASELRNRIKAAKKTVTDRLALIIRPAYEALQSLYDLQKELVGPIDQADVIITGRMKEFKLEEARQIAAANMERMRKEEQLRREAAEKEAAAAKAKTKQMADKLTAQAERAAAEAKEVSATPMVAPVKAVGTSTRTVKKWKCVSLVELAKAVGAEELPEDCIMVNTVRMNEYFRNSPADVAQMPGIEVFEDVQIVNR